MRTFFPSFFAFLIVVFVLIALYSNEMMTAALVFLGSFLMIVLYCVLTGLVGVGALMGYGVWQRYSNESKRPVDGAFPLQKKRLRGGATMYINPNLMIGAAAIVDRDGNYTEPEHPAGWAAVGAVRAAVERTNLVRAMFPGDAARKHQYGAMSSMPRVNASTMKQLETTQQKAQDVPQLPAPKRTTIAASAAFRDNTRTTLALGNTDSGVHRWDLTLDPHVRFHGATQGAGKTNAAKTLLLGAIAVGHRVVVCDRRQFKNFAGWQGKAELVATNDVAAFIVMLERVVELYQRRDRELADSGRADIGNGQRLIVLAAEFGALCKAAQASGDYAAMSHPLSLIVREAGACGVHMIFEDQVAVKGTWPADVIANSGAYVGRMPSRGGQTVGYYHSDKLPPYSFYHDGEVIATWNVSTFESQVLAQAPTITPLFGGSVVRRGVSTTSSEPPNEPPSEPSGPTDLQAMAWTWRARNPGGTQAEMRRELGISKGYANQLWHTYQEPETAAQQLQAMGINWKDVEVKGKRVR